MQTILLVTLVIELLLGAILVFGVYQIQRRRTRLKKQRRHNRAHALAGSAGGQTLSGDRVRDEYASPAYPAANIADTMEESEEVTDADFYHEVATLLEAELKQNPQRSDLRFRLLEIYAAMRRDSDFLALAKKHHAAMEGRADDFWARIASMGFELIPGEVLFSNHRVIAGEVETKSNHRRFYDAVNAEHLLVLQNELDGAARSIMKGPEFWSKLRSMCGELIGPPQALVHAQKLSHYLGGAQIFLHNNAERSLAKVPTVSSVGQVLLAKNMGRTQVLASPAGGGHALAVASAARILKMRCRLMVTEQEMALRAEELSEVGALGAEVEVMPENPRFTHNEGQRAALSSALEELKTSLYIAPIDAGPFPYPRIVQSLHGLAGRDLKSQLFAMAGRMPSAILVSTADGMPAIGFMQAFLGTEEVSLYCVDSRTRGNHRYLDREHAWLRATGRVNYSRVAPDVARFSASYCLPDGMQSIHNAGGEVMAETFALSQQYNNDHLLVAVIPTR